MTSAAIEEIDNIQARLKSVWNTLGSAYNRADGESTAVSAEYSETIGINQ